MPKENKPSNSSHLPVLQGLDDLRESNTDNRMRLQKSMRAGLLNVKKSVDTLAISFERSLIIQGESQAKLFDANLQFQEESLEQGKHAGHLMMSKLTAIGAGFVAFFEKKLLDELVGIKDGIALGSKRDDDGNRTALGEIRALRLAYINPDKGMPKMLKYLNSIEFTNRIMKSNLIGINTGLMRVAKSLDLPYLRELSDKVSIITGVGEKEQQKTLEEEREEQLEKETEKTKPKDNAKEKEVKQSGLMKWLKTLKGFFIALAGGIGFGALLVSIHNHWEGFKTLLQVLLGTIIGVKDILSWMISPLMPFIKDNWQAIADVLAAFYVASKVIRLMAWLGMTNLAASAATLMTAPFRLLKVAALALAVAASGALQSLWAVVAPLAVVAAPYIAIAALVAGIVYSAWQGWREISRVYRETGSVWRAFKRGFYVAWREFLIIIPNLAKDFISWIARKFGFEEFSDKLDKIDIRKEFDNMVDKVKESIKGIFGWFGEQWDRFTNAIKDLLFGGTKKVKGTVASDYYKNIENVKTQITGNGDSTISGNGAGIAIDTQATEQSHRDMLGGVGSAVLQHAGDQIQNNNTNINNATTVTPSLTATRQRVDPATAQALDFFRDLVTQ
jgi:hypothetical protein